MIKIVYIYYRLGYNIGTKSVVNIIYLLKRQMCTYIVLYISRRIRLNVHHIHMYCTATYTLYPGIVIIFTNDCCSHCDVNYIFIYYIIIRNVQLKII